MTEKEAIDKYNTSWWVTASAKEIAVFQLNEPLLCCPFSIFHSAMETVLRRPIFTHEFAYIDRLLQELDSILKDEK